jgi:hypothetical protein
MAEDEEAMLADRPLPAAGKPKLPKLSKEERRAARAKFPAPTPIEEVVGVILGSPEFQRR